jgi:hypothetical protein
VRKLQLRDEKGALPESALWCVDRRMREVRAGVKVNGQSATTLRVFRIFAKAGGKVRSVAKTQANRLKNQKRSVMAKERKAAAERLRLEQLEIERKAAAERLQLEQHEIERKAELHRLDLERMRQHWESVKARRL